MSKENTQEPKPISDIVDQYKINGCAPINADSLYKSEVNRPLTNGHKGLIQPGQVLNPKGRPKGSLNKIQSLFYDDLYQDWIEHGAQSVIDLRESSPVKYVQLVASIMPKSIEVDDKGSIKWVINSQPLTSEDDWRQRHELLRDDTQVIESIEDDTDQT